MPKKNRVQRGKICSVSNCSRDAFSRDLCYKHYHSWDTTYKPKGIPSEKFEEAVKAAELERKNRPKPECSIEGCSRPAWSRGMCNTHYAYWLKDQKRDAPPPDPKERCSIEGCNRPVYGRGWCFAHYKRNYANATPGTTPIRGDRALEDLGIDESTLPPKAADPRSPPPQILKALAPKQDLVLPNNWIGLSIFYDMMFAQQGFTLPPHLLHLIMALADPRISKLIAIVGPGSGKSLSISVTYPAFILGQDPTNTILGISAGENLIQGFVSAVGDWIEKDAMWKALYPKVTPDKDKGWSTEKGLFVSGHPTGNPDSSYFGAGLTSKALTGKHGRIIIGDDLHDKENSNGLDACMRVRNTYYSQIIGRADPRGARFLFAGRRWHQEDIYGHLIDTGEWVVLHLPAFRDNSKEVYWDITIPEGLTCCFNDPETESPDQLPIAFRAVLESLKMRPPKTSTPQPDNLAQI